MAHRRIKRFFVWLVSLLVIGIGVAISFPAGQWGVIGLVRGDSFFHGRPTSYWRFELGDITFGGHERATNELVQGGPAAVPVLVDMLRGKEWHDRCEAADILARIGPKAQDAVPALVQAMKDPEQHVRWRAEKALDRILPDDPKDRSR
jgi:hypothetical protein